MREFFCRKEVVIPLVVAGLLAVAYIGFTLLGARLDSLHMQALLDTGVKATETAKAIFDPFRTALAGGGLKATQASNELINMLSFTATAAVQAAQGTPTP